MMLTLTFCTGICDAVGYLALDRVFTGNMTGNVVILGMALGQADDLPIAGPLIALITFVVFAGVAGRVVRRHPDGWPTPVSAIFGTVAVVLAAVAVWSVFVDVRAQPVAMIAAGIIAAVMGLQAAAARHVGVKDITTVVVTSALTGLAADFRHPDSGKDLWKRRIASVAMILLGACVGAVLLRFGVATGLGLAAALTAGVAILGHRYSADRDRAVKGSADVSG
jgi:uncharacterized membrane protein YoaK (UPF0700 family)